MHVEWVIITGQYSEVVGRIKYTLCKSIILDCDKFRQTCNCLISSGNTLEQTIREIYKDVKDCIRNSRLHIPMRCHAKPGTQLHYAFLYFEVTKSF